MQVIDKTKDLAAVCEQLAHDTFVTVDTEFMRESTYYPQLCLIQMAGADVEALVDPLADNLDLAPFFELMTDQSVLKVFHAARQDIEIIYNLSETVPAPLFDTQIAAMVCGFGDSVSYQNLARELADAQIDKSSQFTDWSARPLSKKQLRYALSDVTHLRQVYTRLAERLAENGRAHWLAEEMAILADAGTYVTPPQDAWKRLKLRVKSKKALAVMIELAAWRERAAMSRNLPRQRVLKDEALFDIAANAPEDKKALAKLRSVSEQLAKSDRGTGILEAVQAGLARDPGQLPALKVAEPGKQETRPAVDLLKVLLQSIASEQKVAAKMIASAEDLRRLANGDRDGIAALTGWRGELFGDQARALLDGELWLAVQDGAVVSRQNGAVRPDEQA